MKRSRILTAAWLHYAAGLVDLKGLDVFLAKKLAEPIYHMVNPQTVSDWQSLGDKTTNTGDFIQSLMYPIISRCAASLGVSRMEMLEGVPLKKLIPKSPILRNSLAEHYFERVVLRLDGEINLEVGGAFQSVRNEYVDQYPSRVDVNIGNALFKAMRKGYWTEESLERILHHTLSHELLHAADWAYSMAGSRDYSQKNHEQVVYDSEGSVSENATYFGRDTEQKSWANSLALDIWGRMQDVYNPGDFYSFLKKPGKDFFKFVKESPRAEILTYLKGAERDKFLLRVFNELKRLAAAWYQNHQEQWKGLGNDHPYQFGKYKEPLAKRAGKVLTVYHGTKAPFEQFQHMKGKRTTTIGGEWEVETGGFFFADNIEDARDYGPHVVECRITLNKPLATKEDNGAWLTQKRQDAAYIFEPLLEKDPSDWRVWLNGKVVGRVEDGQVDLHDWWIDLLVTYGDGIVWGALDNPEIANRMRQRGYDGTLVAEPDSSSGYSYFVLDQSQIEIVRWVK